MTRRMLLVLLLAIAGLLTSLGSYAIPQSKTKADAVADAIARLRAEWVTDLHDKRLEEITLLYAPDAVFLSDNVGRVTGRAAIRDLCQKAMGAITSSMTMHSVRTEAAGDLAYDSGDYDETIVHVSDGKKEDLKGSYLMVFKRQPDGKWLILEQMWTDLTPASHSDVK